MSDAEMRKQLEVPFLFGRMAMAIAIAVACDNLDNLGSLVPALSGSCQEARWSSIVRKIPAKTSDASMDLRMMENDGDDVNTRS